VNVTKTATPFDKKSVMHYPIPGVGGTKDFAISALDIKGAQAIYGAPNRDFVFKT
jgi:hypothetical protein